jgi:hypothetical protein
MEIRRVEDCDHVGTNSSDQFPLAKPLLYLRRFHACRENENQKTKRFVFLFGRFLVGPLRIKFINFLIVTFKKKGVDFHRIV